MAVYVVAPETDDPLRNLLLFVIPASALTTKVPDKQIKRGTD